MTDPTNAPATDQVPYWPAVDASDAKPPRPPEGEDHGPPHLPVRFTETAKRRSSYIGGAPVVTLDGQTWFVPRPRVRFSFADEDGFTVCLSMGSDDRYAELMADWERSLQDDNGGDLLRVLFKIFRYMLGINYDLSTDD